MNLNMSGDYVVFDENDHHAISTNNVTFISKRTTGDVAITCANTIRINKVVSEAEKSGGVYVKMVADFELAVHPFANWSADVPIYNIDFPRVGDEIQENEFAYAQEDDGQLWKIIEVRSPVFNDYIGCKCVAVDINDHLDDIVSIYSNTESTNYEADRLLNPIPTQPNLRARLQPNIHSIDNQLGKRILIKSYFCYIKGLSNYIFSYGDFVLDSNNKKYKIVRVSNDRSLTDLICLEVERIDV